MKKGFVKLYRDYGDRIWSSDPNTIAVLVHCLWMANYREQSFNGRIIPVGSFVTSLDSMERHTGVTKRGIRTALKRLKDDTIIDIETTQRYTIISVLDYSNLQDESECERHKDDIISDTNVTRKRHENDTTDDTKVTTIIEEENNNIEKEKKTITSTNVDVPIAETSAGKKKNLSLIKEKKEKKYTITHRCRLVFEQQYLQKKGEDYYYTPKDAQAIKQLLNKIKSKMPDEEKDNEESLETNFTAFIQAILNSGKVEKWVLDNFSLPVINSKFNEIYAQLKNGTSRQQPNNGSDPNCRISRDFLERTMREAGIM